MILVTLTYSQFFPWIWGFKASSHQRASRPVQGIVLGSLLAVAATFIVVVSGSGWQQQDARDWAWIDVVRIYFRVLVVFI